MNQNFYYESDHRGLVSDENGNIKIVETNPESDKDSIQKVLKYENRIEELNNSIQADQSLLENCKKSIKDYLVILAANIAISIDILIIALLFNVTIIPIIFFPNIMVFSCLSCYLNKKSKDLEKSISRKIERRFKLEEECNNFISECNYKVVEPCESLKTGNNDCVVYDVAIHDNVNDNFFDTSRGKLLTLTRNYK